MAGRQSHYSVTSRAARILQNAAIINKQRGLSAELNIQKIELPVRRKLFSENIYETSTPEKNHGKVKLMMLIVPVLFVIK